MGQGRRAHLAGVTLDHDVLALLDFTSAHGVAVRGTRIRRHELLVVRHCGGKRRGNCKKQMHRHNTTMIMRGERRQQKRRHTNTAVETNVLQTESLRGRRRTVVHFSRLHNESIHEFMQNGPGSGEYGLEHDARRPSQTPQTSSRPRNGGYRRSAEPLARPDSIERSTVHAVARRERAQGTRFTRKGDTGEQARFLTHQIPVTNIPNR